MAASMVIFCCRTLSVVDKLLPCVLTLLASNVLLGQLCLALLLDTRTELVVELVTFSNCFHSDCQSLSIYIFTMTTM